MLRCARCWLYFVLCSFLPQPAPGAEPGGYWPQWRGPNRDNISTETGLLQAWPEGGPPLLWSVEGIGNGIAAVAVAEGNVYTVGYIGEHEYVTALDEHSGERLWTTAIGPAVEESPRMRWLSQRTPTVDETRLYAIHTSGQLVCLSTSDGLELWRKDYAREFGGGRFRWGYCDRPLMDGERLICAPGSPEALLAALDKHTGAVIWKTPLAGAFDACYGAVIPARLGGTDQYITCPSGSAIGIEASRGSVLWQYAPSSGGTFTTHTPMLLGEQMLWPSDFGRRLHLLQYRAVEDPAPITEVYARSAGLNAFQDAGFVLGEHYYYAARGGNLASCTAWRTGDLVWSKRRPLPAATDHARSEGSWGGTFADGRLYSLSSGGRVRLAAISPTGFEETGIFDLPQDEDGGGATLPVVTGGRLYLRTENVLFCYGVSALQSPQPPGPARIVLSPPPADVAGRDGQRRVPRPIFVPTPQDVVERMLELAKVEKDDKVVDLGSGDGRIVIAAAKTYGCRAVGYEIDQELVKVSQQQIAAEELSQLAEIKAEDMYTADLSDVGVVAVYVYPSVLEKMKPQFAQLPAGARIVSHQFEIPGFEPNQTIEVDSEETGGRHRILLYTAPLTGSENTP